jgi:hypothetical protein
MDISSEVLSFVTKGSHRVCNDAERDDLVERLFRRQANKIPPYANFCRLVGFDFDGVKSVNDVPAFPQAAFKSSMWLGSEPRGEYAWFFQTSGTSTGRRGVRPVARMDVYEEVSVAGLVDMLRREFAELTQGLQQRCLSGTHHIELRLPFFFVKEDIQQAPNSSLSWMFEFWRRRLGTASSRFILQRGRIIEEALIEQIWRHPEQPVVIAGTALGLLSWAEQRGREFLLPNRSIVIETGGFKGRRRAMPKGELYKIFSQFFGLPQDRIVNEYGMTEIFSQSYARGVGGLHVSPPWLYVRMVDPFTGRLCVNGQTGVIEVVDLANVDCVPAVQTEDLGVIRKGGFELVGRASAELRGCSLEVGL